MNGEAYCQGNYYYGQLGNRDAGPYTVVPTPVSGDLRFKSITAGSTHTCALTPTGAAYCWGENDAGQLGRGRVFGGGYYEPAPVAGPR